MTRRGDKFYCRSCNAKTLEPGVDHWFALTEFDAGAATGFTWIGFFCSAACAASRFLKIIDAEDKVRHLAIDAR